jgi:hypothetical protein
VSLPRASQCFIPAETSPPSHLTSKLRTSAAYLRKSTRRSKLKIGNKRVGGGRCGMPWVEGGERGGRKGVKEDDECIVGKQREGGTVDK